MQSPFVNISLDATVMLHPSQLNNDIKLNIKKNVEKLEGMCYREHGYIVKIFNVITDNLKGGYIGKENPLSSPTYSVKFNCRLCKPINKTTIVCKVEKIIKGLIKVVNGPIVILITNGRINTDKFIIDHNNILQHKVDDTFTPIIQDMYVYINILSTRFDDKDNKISGFGTLVDIASEKDIKLFFKDNNINNDDKIETI